MQDIDLDRGITSRAESPEIQIERPTIQFSSFKPSEANIKDLGHGNIKVTLAPGEVICPHNPLAV